MTTGTQQAPEAHAPPPEQGENQTPPEQPREPGKVYSGLIKSFNARRGFGFIVCEETAEEYHRDVFISKAERDKNGLQEGDPCLFELQFSTEGHPQAVNVEKIQRYQGRVVGTTHDRLVQFGIIERSSWPASKILNASEISAPKAEFGILVLYPNDKVSFQIAPRDAWQTPNQRNLPAHPIASKILLHDTSSSSSLSSCFEMEAPLACRGHTIGNEVFLSLPHGLDVELLKKVLPKIGASNITVSDDLNSARATFSSLQGLIKVLNHRSLGLPTVEGGNTVAAVQMRPPQSQKEAFWKSPTLTKIHNDLRWENQPNVTTYTLEVRLPSSSSWIALDSSGRPTALAKLSCHVTSVNISSLGPILEARLSYTTLCGCHSGYGTITNMNAMNMHPKVNHKMLAPAPPEILRHTQYGISIRWTPQPDVHEYVLETLRSTGEFEVKNITGQSYIELQGGDHMWARIAYVDVKHHRTSPFSQKLVIPPRSHCTWTVDDVTGLPRRRCSWDQRHEPITLWLD